MAARAGVQGAFLNVKINAKNFDDKAFVESILTQGKEIEQAAIRQEQEIMKIVNKKIDLSF